MSISSFIKSLQNIMRNDAGVNGDAQRIEQIVWLLFLKVYDSKEEIWEFHDDNFQSIIPEQLRWRNWAVDEKDGQARTGDSLLTFVDEELIPSLKNIEVDEHTPISKAIVTFVFEDTYNYMKDGVLLRQVINVIDGIDFTDHKERHNFNDIYEQILKDLQNQRSSGEYYTPRAVTDFMVQMIKPQLGERVADFATGTGGFLTSSLNFLEKQVNSVEDKELYNESVFGIEKKALPHLLSITNLLLHDIDNPFIIHGNSLEKNVRDYTEKDRFEVILMNPPYGGSEKDNIKMNFPIELRSSETADLFMSVIMYRLKKDGRVGIVLPDGFLFGTDNSKIAIKEKLFKEFNVHTIIRLPHSVFAPYTSIHTNILFFDKTHPTEETWFYRFDMPEGYKNFSKTKSIKFEHFQPVMDWWENRKEIIVDGFDKSKKFPVQEIVESNYNLDLCGFSKVEDIILDPEELMVNYQEERSQLNKQIDNILDDIQQALGDQS
ncbi:MULTISPECIES: N-6 DNA methylase [Staphylococcaceae]|uniref:class I SAM-dependent DNA methyltransferase n=1 Tax=Staphylococcaceae TaxID=90964 RepID=UPI00194F528D|nr:class I SAM-dependent DNA methyltransferase [Mammaliicoccus sciuri]MEB6097180.1 type I restriction-modification system subunit M [Mammaliicoccus sciuri]MEB7769591.1 type I restriction-modification system subunit M [Mammaliicoccus sciuri]MEB7819698.1 type I restriction-modification system subunit M [Mammaliicoccus sciuri]